jgi:hypothetical protein
MWHRWFRWIQSSPAEAAISEKRLLDLNEKPLERLDVFVGPRKEDVIHTLQGGSGRLPLVVAPGYAAGAGK